ncbi:MAG: SMC-Scp complex subunit ScpB [Deltaproteobacteria bacterium]|nr:SMC-Scp complex subunit ScpB [Deltaproteobacteria bacterium]
MEHIKAIIEALVFASESPLSIDRIAETLEGIDRKEIVAVLSTLAEEHEARGGGFLLKEVAQGFQFRTRPSLGSWIRRLKRSKPLTLTPAALETLAIVAYRQPVVKAEIDRIRGVDAGGPLKGLLEKKLVRIQGRKDVPGRPIIYGTTKKFLEVFTLKDLSELPTLKEFKDLQG